MAAQTITDEVYGAHTDVAAANLKMSEVQKLSEVTITKSSDTINVKDGKVVYVKPRKQKVARRVIIRLKAAALLLLRLR